jgi:C1A family cysteine protease
MLKSQQLSKKHKNLINLYKLFCKVQKKRFTSLQEWKYRLKVFKKNLKYFILPEDDVLDRIQIEHSKDSQMRILIIPDKRLSVDFYDDDEEDPTIFELNKFADYTPDEMDNLFHIDQSFFNQNQKETLNNSNQTNSSIKIYGTKNVQEYILKMESEGYSFDQDLRDRYFKPHDPIENISILESHPYHKRTPHFSTENGDISSLFNDSGHTDNHCGQVTHKNFFNKFHPRMLYTEINIPSNIRNISVDGVQVPTYLNWKKLKAITPIKDQKKCNACYAFAGLGAVEAHYKIKTGQTVSLSEQEIVDCSPANQACRGGLPHYVFEYIKSKGISYEREYPYKNRKDSCTRSSSAKWGSHNIRGHRMIPSGVLNLVKEVTNGPVSTVSYASYPFKLYRGGMFVGQGCYGKSKPNHASVLIGYSMLGARKYLYFKNGWGENWGERGFYKVKMGDLNNKNKSHCLLASTKYNVIPIL